MYCMCIFAVVNNLTFLFLSLSAEIASEGTAEEARLVLLLSFLNSMSSQGQGLKGRQNGWDHPCAVWGRAPGPSVVQY